MPEIIRPIDELYVSGFSGAGAKGVNLKQLPELIDYCLSRSVMIHTIETFVIKGEWEVSTIELGLYGPDPETSDLPWEEQVSLSVDEARSIVMDASMLGVPVIFNVWLDEKV